MNIFTTLALAFGMLFGASTAMAMDLTNKLAFDSEIEFLSNVDTMEDFTLTYTANLNYDVAVDVSLYAESVFDLRDPEFDGLEFGVNWTPNAGGLVLSAFGTVDSEFENDEYFVSATFSF